MPKITVVGTGPGPICFLTKEAETELLRAEKIFFRMSALPAYEWLRGLGKHLLCFDKLYDTPWAHTEDMYKFMVDALLKEAIIRGEAVYAVPGSPDVLEFTTNLIRELAPKQSVEVRVLPGLSFLELALAEVNFDYSDGLQVVLPLTHLKSGRFTERLALLVCHMEARNHPDAAPRVDLTLEFLRQKFPAGHRVRLIWTDGMPDYQTHSRELALEDLVQEYGEARFFASLFVPSLEEQ